MNKLFTKIAALALGATMAVGVGVAVSSASNSKEVAPVGAADGSVSKSAATLATENSWTQSAGSTIGTVFTSFDLDDYITVSFAGTGNTATYWTDVRMYGTKNKSDASVTFTGASGVTIKTITLTFSTSNSPSFSPRISSGNAYTVNGNSQTFTMTSGSKNGQMRITNFACTYTYTAAKTLSSIALSGTYPTIFTQGDTFSHSGMTVTATYSDSTTADVTSSATFSGYNMSTTGNQTVTVSYTEGGTTKTTTYSITINAPKTPASVSSSGQTTTFDDGNTFAYGGTLTATYTDSTSKTVSPTSFKIGNAGINPTSAGTVITPGSTTLSRDDHNGKTVYVLYTENNTTVYTSYVITVNAVSSATFTYGTDNTTGSTMTKSGATLTIGTPGTDGTFDTNSNNCYKIFKNKTLVVSSTRSIAKVEFTCTASGTSQYGPGCFTADVGSYTYSGTEGTWTGSATSITFTASTNQVRPTLIKVTFASNDPLVELDASSATSVSMMKGDTDTTVKVHVINITTKNWTFTFDEGESTGLSTSAYINVSAGAAVSDVHTLTITTKAVGSTTIHIAVSGTACETAVPVTVNAKPASMMVTESDHETQITTLELQTGGSVKQVYWIGEDTDGNAYSIAAAQVNGEIISGSSYVTISSGAGTNITPVAPGTAVIRYSLKVLSSVYAEITVNVVDDYKTTVNSITFNSNLSDTQGDPVNTSAVFATRVANTHFGSTDTILDSELLFSYENNRSGAEGIEVFSYDFSHGTTVDATHKLQTIYVFTSFDSSYGGSFSITVEQKNDPLTAITISNVVNNEKEMERGTSFQLEIVYTPTNPTDGKEVVYRVDDNDDDLTISVSATGLIEIGAASNLGTALIVVESAHDATIHDYVYVTATLESMTYIVRETETWSLVDDISTLSAGDQVILTGVKSEVTYAAGLYTGGNNVPADTENTLTVSGTTVTGVVSTMIYTLEEGSEEGSIAFKGSDSNYLCAASSSKNYMHSKSTIDGESSFILNADGSVVAQGSFTRNYMRYNNSSTSNLFACYASDSTTGELVTFYKKSGGDTPYTVTEDLFNGVHDNFGAEKTYEWSESCPSFNSATWLSACNALKGITDYSTYKLNRAVANASGNEIEIFLAKYDNIVTKFGTTYDYLGRFAEGGINYGARIGNINPISIIGANSDVNVIAIVVITSVVSLTAIGGYFFLRKRKENI